MTIDEILKINKNDAPHFSVFARDKMPLVGQKIHVQDILDKEILITDFRIIQSKHRPGGNCLQLQLYFNDTVYVLFTGSNVLINEIRESAEYIPFYTRITKADKYFSFT